MRKIRRHALLKCYFLRTLFEFYKLSEISIGFEDLVGGIVS